MKMGLGAQVEVLNGFSNALQIFNTPKMCDAEFSAMTSSTSVASPPSNVATSSVSNRSTKGASKQRRDLINVEIGNLRDMLPLPESARQRLSQLQIMSLACCYIRKSNYFARLFGDAVYATGTPFEFSQAMAGFLLIATREGKLLYISDNVTEYLGHSMVDMLTQGDSLYDIIDKRDHASVQTQLLQTTYSPCPDTGLDSRAFFCRMNVSRSFRRQAGFGDHKVMHVRGHFIQPLIRDHYGNQQVFMATCAPLITPDAKDAATSSVSTLVFQSVHGLDMKFVEIAQNGTHHLGYSNAEIFGKSWYELLHPEDVVEAKEKHVQLIKSSHEMGCMLTVRLLAADGAWVWVNTVMHVRQPYLCENGDPAIVCINQIISDSEAALFKMQSQLESSHIARSPEFLDPIQGGVAPSHIITQVATDAEQLQSMPLLRLLNEPGATPTTFYEAQVAIAPAPSGGDSGSGGGSPTAGGQQQQGGNTPTTTAAFVGPPTSGLGLSGSMATPSSGAMSDSGSSSPSDGSGSPREILRAEIINRINLKRIAQQHSGAGNQACKPAKRPRLAHSRNDSLGGGLGVGLGGLNITGSVFITPATGGGRLGGNSGAPTVSSGGFAGAQVLAPSVAPGNMFAGLSLKNEELLIPETVQELVKDFTGPLTPESPSDRADSPGSTTSNVPGASGPAPGSLTALRVDTTTVPRLPLSLLTPESSPTMPDFPTMLPPGGEQQVPGGELSELEEALKYMQAEAYDSLPVLKVKVEKKDADATTTTGCDAILGLPQLDIGSIEDYFNAVGGRNALDRKLNYGLKVDVKMEPLSPPQSSAGSPCPAPSPCAPSPSPSGGAPSPASSSLYTESLASPASLYASSSVCGSPSASSVYSDVSTASTVYCDVTTPAAQQQQQQETAATTEADLELSSLVNTVAEAIFNIVQQQNGSPGNGETTTMGSNALATAQKLVAADDNKKPQPPAPGDVMMSDDVTTSLMTSQPEADLPAPDPVAEAALIDELHQLDQLAAAAAPSYGDAGSLGAIFDETL